MSDKKSKKEDLDEDLKIEYPVNKEFKRLQEVADKQVFEELPLLLKDMKETKDDLIENQQAMQDHYTAFINLIEETAKTFEKLHEEAKKPPF